MIDWQNNNERKQDQYNKYPSLDEIYDLTTQDLQLLQVKLQKQLHGKIKDNNYIYTLLETIKIEIQQRKTIDFFTQMYAIDNPYLQKIQKFKNQFVKLASQAIQIEKRKQQKQDQSSKNQLKLQTNHNLDNFTNQSTISRNGSIGTPNLTHDQLTVHTAKTVSQTDGDNLSTFSEDKKMGLMSRMNQKKKKDMKAFIQQTLMKSRGVQYVVLGRNGVSPSTNLKKVDNKSAIQGNSKKNQQQQRSVQKTDKKTKINQQKQKKQMIDKVKNMTKKDIKPPIPKNNNNNGNKKLVDMIKKQQQQKAQKKIKDKQKAQMAKSQQIIMKIQQKKLIQEQIQEKIQIDIIDEKNNNQNIQTIKQQKIIIIKVNNNQQKLNRYSNIQKQQIIIQQQIQESMVQLKSNKFSQELKKKDTESIPLNNNKNNIIIDNNINEDQVNYNKQINHVNNENSQVQIKVNNANSENIKNDNSQLKLQLINYENEFRQINKNININYDYNHQYVDKSQEKQEVRNQIENQIKNTPQQVHKRCYDQQYWIHIKEEAQLKIKRFRQEKQLEKHINQRQQSKIASVESSIQKNQQIQFENTDDDKSSHQGTSRSTNEDNKNQFIEQANVKSKDNPPQELKNLKNFLKKQSKKPVLTLPKKIIHPKPQFNYLQIFPSFNHLFSVMYAKPQPQAINDIPNIMRQTLITFEAHVQKLGKAASHFRPAMFMPFDCPSGMSGLPAYDPRNLLLYTQNTYVDLKNMVERLQIFNQNIHGQFESINKKNLENNWKNTKYYRVVKSKQEVYDIITTAFLRKRGWKELPHGHSLKATWNLFWSWGRPDLDLNKLLTIQKVNHFPFNKNLSRKDLLYRNLDSFRRNYKVQMNFLPTTYILPKQFSQFSAKFHQQQLLSPNNYWIMKPIGKSRGRGIKVINNLAELNYTDNIVVQKYIANPLLVQGYKFDMRVYALVTSFHPLQAFVYKEGFARFSTEKFSLDPSSIKNTFIHLTNFAINRHNNQPKKDNDKQNLLFQSGSKISLKMLQDHLIKMGFPFSKIWKQVHDIIIKSLLACSVHVPKFPSSFQLFGYDVMIDDQGACHLIEINSSPSLERAYMLDEVIKQSLIDDIMQIVDPPQIDKQALLTVLNERLGTDNHKKFNHNSDDDLTDLARILKYQPIRKIGQKPKKLGLFEMIAPNPYSIQIQKTIKSKSGLNNMQNID